MTGLRLLAREVAGPGAELTEVGAWGPWVDGGGWLQVRGAAVDWLYRDVGRVRAAWDDAQQGRYRFHAQVGHPLGVPDFAYAGRSRSVSCWPTRAASWPSCSRRRGATLLRCRRRWSRGLWEAQSFLLAGARKAARRGDTAYVAGCLFRVVGVCVHALHGRAGRWLVNEKGAVRSAARLPLAPPGLVEKVGLLLGGLGTSPDELRRGG